MENKSRFFDNNYLDSNKYPEKGIITETFSTLFIQIDKFYENVNPSETLKKCSVFSKSSNDFSIYDGAGGNLQVYLKLYKFALKREKYIENLSNFPIEKINLYFDESKYIKDAISSYNSLKKLIEEKFEKIPEKIYSFFFGSIGVFILGFELNIIIKNSKEINYCLNSIKKTIENFKNSKGEYYHELLYGSSGLLYSLLTLQKIQKKYGNNNLYENKFDLEQEIYILVQIIYESGEKSSNNDKKSFRLTYYFCKNEYLGAAHGLFGILYILLQAYKENSFYFLKQNPEFVQKLLNSIERSYNYASNFQYESGNFAPGMNLKSSDELIQFCHGGPGVIPSLLLASEILKEKKYEEQAKKAGDNIWKKGILKKGFGICHGISGNAYAFNSLYRFFKENKWIYRSFVFANSIKDDGINQGILEYSFEDRFKKGESDFPYSLMIGTGGDIAFLIDLLDIEESRFPGYEI